MGGKTVSVCVCVFAGGEGVVCEVRQSHVWYGSRRARAQSKGLVKPLHGA